MKVIVLIAMTLANFNIYQDNDITSPKYGKIYHQYIIENLLTHQYKTGYFGEGLPDTGYMAKETWDALQDTLVKRPIKSLPLKWRNDVGYSPKQGFKVLGT